MGTEPKQKILKIAPMSDATIVEAEWGRKPKVMLNGRPEEVLRPIENQIPPTGECFPESLPDPLFEKFAEYVATHWQDYTIMTTLSQLSRAAPMFCPSPLLWRIPQHMYNELGTTIRLIMVDNLKRYWPSLKVVLGDNTANFAWAAGVATAMAIYDFFAMLPNVLLCLEQAEKELKDNAGLAK